ncbi:substrate-binding periplasmic protein [Undibacterium sp.]|uniref:substrate-binding periplasmic protein n=1 Tax=Undibacterium sp. TaxID=1914977 RepID=UPI003751A3F1
MKQDTINITTEHYYPYSIADKDGAVYGASADKIHELFKRSKLVYQMNIMSWNRAFELARNNANTCVFSTSRTKEREASFHWIGPIMTGNWSVFGSPDKLNKVTSLKDIKQSSIGTEEGQVSLSYLSGKGFKMVTSTESVTTFKNVALGRIDYATAADTHGKKIIADNNLNDKIVWLFNYSSSDYYLACNPKIPSRTIALLNKNLREMRADGSFKIIENKY